MQDKNKQKSYEIEIDYKKTVGEIYPELCQCRTFP